MSTVLVILAGLFVAFVYVLGWALCAASKRGDEMDDELAQFHHRTWEPLP